MEDELIKLMEQIVDNINSNEYSSFYLNGNKFHFIDKDRMIDFEAIIGNHNYYLKDNIEGNMYIATRKRIGDGVFIHHIIMQNKVESESLSFFSKDNMTGLIKTISKDEEETLICENPDCISRLGNTDQLLEYINEFFAYDEEDYDLYDEEEHDLYADNEEKLLQDLDDQEKTMLDIEEGTEFEYADDFISDSELYDINDDENGEKYDEIEGEYDEIEEEYDGIEEEHDELEEEYDADGGIFENDFLVTINQKEINGYEKIQIISSCAVDLIDRYQILQEVSIVAENLRDVLKVIEKER